LKSIHHGHPQVEYRQVWGERAAEVERLCPVGGFADHIELRRVAQGHPQANTNVGIVVCNEDAGLGG
jgi:hypothetical protein